MYARLFFHSHSSDIKQKGVNKVICNTTVLALRDLTQLSRRSVSQLLHNSKADSFMHCRRPVLKNAPGLTGIWECELYKSQLEPDIPD